MAAEDPMIPVVSPHPKLLSPVMSPAANSLYPSLLAAWNIAGVISPSLNPADPIFVLYSHYFGLDCSRMAMITP